LLSRTMDRANEFSFPHRFGYLDAGGRAIFPLDFLWTHTHGIFKIGPFTGLFELWILFLKLWTIKHDFLRPMRPWQGCMFCPTSFCPPVEGQALSPPEVTLYGPLPILIVYVIPCRPSRAQFFFTCGSADFPLYYPQFVCC